MKKVDLDTGKHNHFIGCWDIDDMNLFTGMINFFEENSKQTSAIYCPVVHAGARYILSYVKSLCDTHSGFQKVVCYHEL